MAKFASLSILLMCVVALGGCAVSGGADLDTSGVSGVQARSTIPLDASQLPPIVDPSQSAQVDTDPVGATSDRAAPVKSEKFHKEDDAILAIASADAAFEDKSTEIEQAYAEAVGEQTQITTKQTSLKPFVGRWVLVPGARKTKAKVQKIGAYLGLTEQCELVLEEGTSGSGHKAYGNSSCPTSLFMLDSWLALGDQLVLRDHMGDDIVKLRSRGTDKWIGVDKRGETLVLSKS